MSVVRSYIRTSFRVAENEWCEHTSGDFKINIKTRPPQLHRKLPGTLIKFMYCIEENALSKEKLPEMIPGSAPWKTMLF